MNITNFDNLINQLDAQGYKRCDAIFAQHKAAIIADGLEVTSARQALACINLYNFRDALVALSSASEGNPHTATGESLWIEFYD